MDQNASFSEEDPRLDEKPISSHSSSSSRGCSREEEGPRSQPTTTTVDEEEGGERGDGGPTTTTPASTALASADDDQDDDQDDERGGSIASQLRLTVTDSLEGGAASTVCGGGSGEIIESSHSDPAVEAYLEGSAADPANEAGAQPSEEATAAMADGVEAVMEEDVMAKTAAVVSPSKADGAADGDADEKPMMLDKIVVPALVDGVVSEDDDSEGAVRGGPPASPSAAEPAPATDPRPRTPAQVDDGDDAEEAVGPGERGSIAASAIEDSAPSHHHGIHGDSEEGSRLGTPLGNSQQGRDLSSVPSLRSQGSNSSQVSKASSMLDRLLEEAKAASSASSDGSVILSDAGESKCDSIVPVINLTIVPPASHSSPVVSPGAGRPADGEELSRVASAASDGSATPGSAASATGGEGKDGVDRPAVGDAPRQGPATGGPGSSPRPSPGGGSLADDGQRAIKTTISSGSGASVEIEATRTSSVGRGRERRERRSGSPRNKAGSPIPPISPNSASVASSGGSQRNKARSPIPPISPNSAHGAGAAAGVSSVGYDKKRLTERLRQRLAKRNQLHGASSSVGSPTKSTPGDEDDGGGANDEVPVAPTSSFSPLSRPQSARAAGSRETRLQAASRQKRRSRNRARAEAVDENEGDAGRLTSDILARYSHSSEGDGAVYKNVYPDAVTFSDGEEGGPDGATMPGRSTSGPLRVDTGPSPRSRRYRKCVSEVGASLSLSTRSARSKLSKHHHSHHHGIGILQADGIVYDDALLLRLARQARYGRLRGEINAGSGEGGGVKRYNDVKIHVYDLLAKDALVDIPYFNCNFPIGQCFKVVNDGCHVLGTGAYHVGVEANGVEYAFGANNIIGMSGIFTCVPKESPGYEFRETLDFGKVHTTKRTWIRVPKSGTGVSFKAVSEALGVSADSDKKSADRKVDPATAPNKDMKHLYSFREIESFADGHTVIHSMAREYMGTDYDLLRKNCCTFARDVCIRLGVAESDIPTWFHNAAQAGADAEDAITNVEYSVRNMLDCAEGLDPLDLECYNHGFEVIPGGNGMKVIESPAMSASSRERRPICDDEDNMPVPDETASWTY